jgi:DNA-binding response OmpR family regulator
MALLVRCKQQSLHLVDAAMEQLQVLTAIEEPAFGKVLRDWLEDAGYGVIQALAPPHGLWELAVNQPGFVIPDVPTKQREMFDLPALILERSPVAVIFLSDVARVVGADPTDDLQR